MCAPARMPVWLLAVPGSPRAVRACRLAHTLQAPLSRVHARSTRTSARPSLCTPAQHTLTPSRAAPSSSCFPVLPHTYTRAAPSPDPFLHCSLPLYLFLCQPRPHFLYRSDPHTRQNTGGQVRYLKIGAIALSIVDISSRSENTTYFPL